MGKGKGKIHRWVRPVRPGSTILELNLETLENKIRLDAFRTRQFKLSVPTYIVWKDATQNEWQVLLNKLYDTNTPVSYLLFFLNFSENVSSPRPSLKRQSIRPF